MTSLVEFLHARYADHRSAALGAKGDTLGEWEQDDGPPEDIQLYAASGKLTMGQARHISRHDPAYVLADLDAKTALLDDLLAERHHVNDGDCWYTCTAATEERDGGQNCDDNRRGDPCDCGRDERVERRLRILAQPFATHPEYLEGWRP